MNIKTTNSNCPAGADIGTLVFAIEVVSLFFARAIFVWFYNRTGGSVLLVAIFQASFDAAINQLSDDVVPASNTVRFFIFSAVSFFSQQR